MSKLLLLFCMAFIAIQAMAQPTAKPRILISTDIGGTDQDDNQSMIHFLMYSNRFNTEGLVSSPSFGFGSKQEILNMIALYEKDLPKLSVHANDFPAPDSLRNICKQGRLGAAPLAGYSTATEGSDWIIHCARKKSNQPLWILVWGGLDDLAQALHDAPDIQKNIKVYWIGGPNKKFSTNCYTYIATHFPNLWFIENNASYRGFFAGKALTDSVSNNTFYDQYIQGAGAMGKAFKNYYGGKVKMGDTPALLYMMNGNPMDPESEHWGGSFEKMKYSPRIAFNSPTTTADTVPVYSIIEFRFKGPKLNIAADSTCFTLVARTGTLEQKWPGYSIGNGEYVVRYTPKQAETLQYQTTSSITGFPQQSGTLIVNNNWPGDKHNPYDFKVGPHWYTDRKDPALFQDQWQGAETIAKWRKEVLLDWAERWKWLR